MKKQKNHKKSSVWLAKGENGTKVIICHAALDVKASERRFSEWFMDFLAKWEGK